MIKKFIVGVLLVLCVVFTFEVNGRNSIVVEDYYHPNGTQWMRFHNKVNYRYSCVVTDYNSGQLLFTTYVMPYTTTGWYQTYGDYIWSCT